MTRELPKAAVAAPAVHPLFADAVAVCRRGVFAAIVFSAVINLLALAVPLLARVVIDYGMAGRSLRDLGGFSLVAAGALLTLAALSVIRKVTLARTADWLERRLGGPLLAAALRAGMRGDRFATFAALQDLATVRRFIVGPGLAALLDVPWAAIYIAALFWIHPWLGFVGLAGIAAVAACAWASYWATDSLFQQADAAASLARRDAEDAVRHAEVAGAMGMTPDIVRRWYKREGESLRFEAAAGWRAAILAAGATMTGTLLVLALVATGVVAVAADTLTLGYVGAGAILLSFALMPAYGVLDHWRSLAAAKRSYHRLHQHFVEMPKRRWNAPRSEPTGRLVVDNLVLTYPGAAAPVLRGVNFDLDPGQSLGIIGPNSAGKTTIARLLVGGLQPDSGQVLFDGIDMAGWEPEDLGRLVGYLPQDTVLFGGTVRENIGRLGEPEAASVIAAAQLAGAHEAIAALPKGYDTLLGDNGNTLSLGQCRLVGLARAVYGEPRLVVLDEPDAGLDTPERESMIQAILRLKSRGIMVVVVTHSPSVLRHMDKVLVLIDGQIGMVGKRDVNGSGNKPGQSRQPPAPNGDKPWWSWR